MFGRLKSLFNSAAVPAVSPNASDEQPALQSPLRTICNAPAPIPIIVHQDTRADLEQIRFSDQIVAQTEPSCSPMTVCTGDVKLGTVFSDLEQAKDAILVFSGCPVKKSSTEGGKYVTFQCFRSGVYKKKDSKVPQEFQRKSSSSKCNCPFAVNLKQARSSGYEVYKLSNQHNHQLLTDEELQVLPQNRFIPEEVRQKFLELNAHGVLTCHQLITLIEKVHFPDVKVTWTTRDVQNLLQSTVKRSHETQKFVQLLDQKKNDGWLVSVYHNPESLRLERVFWISSTGLRSYRCFNDVLQIDATYKTNRFGLPLILFTAIDNHGITILVAGCFVSNEKSDSYLWTLQQFQNSTSRSPTVVFTDGDHELARAIQSVWPSSRHFLCRFHICQNIMKALSSKLGNKMSDFLKDFWEICKIEDVEIYDATFAEIEAKWSDASDYLAVLREKETKWASAYTHDVFVAGVASTQRQESVNHRIKALLMSNSALIRLIDGFDNVEKKTSQKQLAASTATKLLAQTSDPIITDALNVLTSYSANLLKQECALALSYFCLGNDETDGVFRVCHKDHPDKFRLVTVDREHLSNSKCSCRKTIWHGIVCRHLLCAFRHTNNLSCPVELLNPRWRKDYIDSSAVGIATDIAFFGMASASDIVLENNIGSNAQRASELSAIAKSIVVQSTYDETVFNMVKASFINISEVVRKTLEAKQTQTEDGTVNIRNFLKVRTKGRPKIGTKRYKSCIEQSKKSRKKQKVHL